MRRHYKTHPTVKDSKIDALEKELISIHGRAYSYKFTRYIQAQIKLLIYCKSCKEILGNGFVRVRLDHLRDTGCPKCGRREANINQTKTHEKYLEELSTFRLEPVEDYVNSGTPILHRYKECGHTILATPRDVLKKKRVCNRCKDFGDSGLEHLLDKPAKLYTFKVTRGRRIAYKLGVTTNKNVLKPGSGRYSSSEDINHISELSYIELPTLKEALRIENVIKRYLTSIGLRYKGKKGLLTNLGNTELFKKEINLEEFLKWSQN